MQIFLTHTAGRVGGTGRHPGGAQLRWRALCICLALLQTGVSAGSSLRLGRTETLDSAGIKLRTFRDAITMPLPAVNSYTLKDNQGQTTDVHLPEDLWRHAQTLGRWGNDRAHVTVAAMQYRLPGGVPRLWKQYVTQAAFNTWSRDPASRFNPDAAALWVTLYTGKPVAEEPEQVRWGSPMGCTAYQYRFKEQADRRALYVIVPRNDTSRRLVLLYELSPGEDPKECADAIFGSMRSVAFFPPRRTNSDDKELYRTPTSPQHDESPEYAASRARVIRNIQHLDDWWYLETDNFILVSNIDNRQTVNQVKDELAKCRAIYQSYYPVAQPLSAISVVRLFDTREGYVSYVGEGTEWTGGIWSVPKKELVISPATSTRTSREERAQVARVMYHEGFHQYAYYATGLREPSPWFNEGNAAYFEGIDFQGRTRFDVELTERIKLLEALMARSTPPIEAILGMGYQQFYNPVIRDGNYALAYGLMYFLHKGAPVLRKENDYAKIPRRYYQALTKSGDPRAATAEAWKDVDMQVFARDFIDFWGDASAVRRAQSYDPLR